MPISFFRSSNVKSHCFESWAARPIQKKHLVLPGGHPIMFEKRSRVIQEALQWFDRYLGTD